VPRVSGARARAAVSASATAGGWVAALAWAPDGTALAVADDAGGVSVLTDGGSGLLPVGEHPGGALSVAWAPGEVLASGGRDGVVALDGGAVARHEHGGRHWVERLAWRPDGGLLAAAVGRRVEFLTPDGGCADVSESLPATVTCLGWHPKGVLCAAGSYGGVRMLRANGGRAAQVLAWKGSVLELAVSPDGRRLAHGNQDASVHFWDVQRGSELEMTGYATKVRELAWSRDGRWLATGGGDELTLWDFHRRGGPAGTRPVQLEHGERVVALAFRPGGELLASLDRGGTVLLWRPAHDDLPVGGTALPGAGTTLAWSPRGDRLAAGDADGTVLVVEVSEE
jgi:WD40 repeat protein